MLPRSLVLALVYAILDFFFACRSPSPSSLKSSVTGGNSGDPIRLTFAKMRPEAQLMVRNLPVDSLNELILKFVPPAFTERVRQFLAVHQSELADDITASLHSWTTEERAACATTGSLRNDAIEFSYRRCTLGSSVEASTATSIDKIDTEFVLMLLIHESVHHFGFGNSPEDEATADHIARLVYNATRFKTISGYKISGNSSSLNPSESELKSAWKENCLRVQELIQDFYGHDSARVLTNTVRERAKYVRLTNFICGTPTIRHEKNRYNRESYWAESEAHYSVEFLTQNIKSYESDQIATEGTYDTGFALGLWSLQCESEVYANSGIYRNTPGPIVLAYDCGKATSQGSNGYFSASSTPTTYTLIGN
ncbi:MAG: hypothetical protein NTV34_07845 [Proteobacteria bacterium]|nr:hypothetical protein [Pseudomonadota bacterium]